MIRCLLRQLICMTAIHLKRKTLLNLNSYQKCSISKSLPLNIIFVASFWRKWSESFFLSFCESSEYWNFCWIIECISFSKMAMLINFLNTFLCSFWRWDFVRIYDSFAIILCVIQTCWKNFCTRLTWLVQEWKKNYENNCLLP